MVEWRSEIVKWRDVRPSKPGPYLAHDHTTSKKRKPPSTSNLRKIPPCRHQHGPGHRHIAATQQRGGAEDKTGGMSSHLLAALVE
eukprot:12895981-Prorocentrum_lima.AAC.1